MFEDTAECDFVSLPYVDVDQQTWDKTAVLSWRWANQKPKERPHQASSTAEKLLKGPFTQ